MTAEQAGARSSRPGSSYKPRTGGSGDGARKFSGKRSFGGDRNGGSSRFPRKKANRFYTIFSAQTTVVDYKDTERLQKFTTEKGKILPRRITGLTAKQQRVLTRAIKRARQAGLLAFEAE